MPDAQVLSTVGGQIVLFWPLLAHHAPVLIYWGEAILRRSLVAVNGPGVGGWRRTLP